MQRLLTHSSAGRSRRRRLKREQAEWQLAIIATLAELPPDAVSREELEPILAAVDNPGNDEVLLRAAMLLSRLYPHVAPGDPVFARRTHSLLLRDLREKREAMQNPSCSWLVMTHLREENLSHIPWESAEEVASAAECFYGFSDAGLSAEDSHRRVRDLVKYAGLRFARQERWEELFRLLSRVPVSDDMMDADMFRLRNAILLYEQRRIARLRRSMTIFIALAAAFILILSPFLFLRFEHAFRAANGMPTLHWSDGLYWSIITGATVGFGDIVPHTTAGRMLAIADSLLGMTLMGVLAGTILSRVTPRSLP